MKANNLSISLPYTECGKSCPYCISKMTGYMKADDILWAKNLKLAYKMAENIGITNVLITSKGEPMSNPNALVAVLQKFHAYPIEIQTNGMELMKEDSFIRSSINVVAVSVDDPSYFEKNTLWDKIKKSHAMARATVLLSNRFKGWKLDNFIQVCKGFEIRQLTFRHATVPENSVASKASRDAKEWIEMHYCNAHYKMIVDEIELTVPQKRLVLKLPFGAAVYDIDGISVSYFDYCIQENSNGEDIRSLIYQEDGHMYLTWDKRGSIIW